MYKIHKLHSLLFLITYVFFGDVILEKERSYKNAVYAIITVALLSVPGVILCHLQNVSK